MILDISFVWYDPVPRLVLSINTLADYPLSDLGRFQQETEVPYTVCLVSQATSDRVADLR